MDESISISNGNIIIDGIPRVLLCTSLFPFRIPCEQWLQRLKSVKTLGYHAIDVYIPWNYHEIEPNIWDFSGQKNIESFLKMTREIGLYALVRPGPYICSEWDGGGIPSWVATNSKNELRQNSPRFLRHVKSWYDHIAPIIARQQYGYGGAVIMVQADNELDFYPCRKPSEYIVSLSEMLRERGISVPIIACAGQGNLIDAGAFAPEVFPAVNLYTDDNDVDFDEQVRYYHHIFSNHHSPMIVTETNRLHRTIRRVIGNGAKFVGPYLQASGWNFDYGTGVNNWGTLESFMTPDYDFGGSIDPSGQERSDAVEGRRLSTIIEALGTRLASATLSESPFAHITSYDIQLHDKSDIACGSLDLHGGGQLLTLTNLSAKDLLLNTRTPELAPLTLPSKAGVMLVRDMPISKQLTLLSTTGELIGLKQTHANNTQGNENEPTTTVVTLAQSAKVSGKFWVTFHSKTTTIEISNPTGDISFATIANDILIQGTTGHISFRDSSGMKYGVEFSSSSINPSISSTPERKINHIDLAISEPRWIPRSTVTGNKAPTLESCGVYRGVGRYQSVLATDSTTSPLGIVLQKASDIISLNYCGAQTQWYANGGGDCFIPLPSAESVSMAPTTKKTLTVTTRIWGHSNFHDTRINSLQLNAGRGISGALVVTKSIELKSGWFIDPNIIIPNPTIKNSINSNDHGLSDDTQLPRVSFGGYFSTQWPQKQSYSKYLKLGEVSAAIQIKDGKATYDIYLNNRFAGSLTPLQSTLMLGNIHNNDKLTVIITRLWGEQIGDPAILLGTQIGNWNVLSYDTTELAQSASFAHFTAHELPLNISIKHNSWIRISEKELLQSVNSQNTIVRFQGDGLQLTAFTDEYCLGRVVLGKIPGATLAGGHGDYILVPEHSGDLRIFIEVTQPRIGTLQYIKVGGILDKI